MNKMELGHTLNIAQTLEMMLSPRMIQMLRMLNLSYADLVEEIEQRSEENVLLEIERPDRLLEYIKEVSSERILKKDISHEDLPGIETLSEPPTSLADHILKQLGMEDIEEKEFKIAEMLIGSLDQRGYLPDYNGISSQIKKKLNASREEIDEALALIQGLEPEGVGARDLNECLLIQVREHNFESEELEEILEKVIGNHLEDLANRDFDKISKALNIPKEGAIHLSEFIKNNLDPNPGSRFAQPSACVIPSFSLKKEDNRYKAVNLEKAYGPVLRINKTYEKMLNDPKTDSKTVTYIKERLQAAKDFLENIEKRHETIEKIMDIIIKMQAGSLEGKTPKLNPLLQKKIADELGLHPSTISRAISNKYLQTPSGTILLKNLCPRDIKGKTSARIKDLIKDMIDHEDKKSPLTDVDISEKLKQSGIALQRRTITAYRNKLGIASASNRVSAEGGSASGGKFR